MDDHMSKKKQVKLLPQTRRQLLRNIGAAGTASLVPSLWTPQSAMAQSAVKDVTVFFFTDGGHSGIFTSADSFRGNRTMGVINNNISQLGNSDVWIDTEWLNMMTGGPNQALVQSCMATVGAVHGQSAHRAARPAVLQAGRVSPLQRLADSMNGESAIKFAQVGREEVRQRVMTENTRAQLVNDIGSLERSLGGQGNSDQPAPNRQLLSASLAGAQALSAQHLADSPQNLKSLAVGYEAGVKALGQRIVSNVTPQQIRRAYGLNGTAVGENIRAKMAAAELLARTGTSVIGISDGGWDNHGDQGQREVRGKWRRLAPSIGTFLNRMLPDPSINLTFVVLGDFSRNHRSGHGGGLAMNIFSNKVRNATTGKLSSQGGLPVGSPGMREFYEFINYLSGAGGTSYNGPHRRVLK